MARMTVAQLQSGAALWLEDAEDSVRRGSAREYILCSYAKAWAYADAAGIKWPMPYAWLEAIDQASHRGVSSQAVQ